MPFLVIAAARGDHQHAADPVSLIFEEVVGQQALGFQIVPDDVGKAAGWLQRGLDERSPNMIYLKVSSTLDPIRGDARAQAVIRTMNFPQ